MTSALLILSAKFNLLISHPEIVTSLGLTSGKILFKGKKTSSAPETPIFVVED